MTVIEKQLAKADSFIEDPDELQRENQEMKSIQSENYCPKIEFIIIQEY